jgi:hypothetical protein
MLEEPIEGRRPDLVHQGREFWFSDFRRVRSVSLDLRPVERGSANVLLRVTAHALSDEEAVEVNRLFPGVRIVPSQRRFVDGREVVQWMRTVGAEEVLLVGPYSVFDQLVRRGIRPLYAEYVSRKFVRLWRCHGLRIEYAEV